jgi:hypothetical protein
MLKWFVVGASALALSACAGFVPPAGLSVQDVEINASASEVEFVGGVEAMGAGSWTVGGVTVAINAETEIDPALAVGDLAKVHAMVAPDASLTGREIRAVESQASSSSQDASSSADSSQAEMEFTGAVVSIDPSAWVVGDQTLAITEATEIKDAIVVGDMVKVHALPQADGSLTAREIELAGPEDVAGADEDGEDQDATKFFGAVEDMQSDHWVVAGTTFLVTPDTEIKDAILLGDFVKVEATQSADGSWVAHEIELEDEAQDEPDADEDQADSTKFFGQVTAMDPGSWTVGGLTFLLTPSTEIKDDIAVGDSVKIEALVGADGSLTALEIELEEDQIGDEEGEDDSNDDQEDEHEDESGDDESEDDDSGNSGSGGSGGDD